MKPEATFTPDNCIAYRDLCKLFGIWTASIIQLDVWFQKIRRRMGSAQ